MTTPALDGPPLSLLTEADAATDLLLATVGDAHRRRAAAAVDAARLVTGARTGASGLRRGVPDQAADVGPARCADPPVPGRGVPRGGDRAGCGARPGRDRRAPARPSAGR